MLKGKKGAGDGDPAPGGEVGGYALGARAVMAVETLAT